MPQDFQPAEQQDQNHHLQRVFEQSTEEAELSARSFQIHAEFLPDEHDLGCSPIKMYAIPRMLFFRSFNIKLSAKGRCVSS